MREHRDTETVCNPLWLDDRRAKVPCQVLCRSIRSTRLLSRGKLLLCAQTVKVMREICQKLNSSICARYQIENYVSCAPRASQILFLGKRELGCETLMDDVIFNNPLHQLPAAKYFYTLSTWFYLTCEINLVALMRFSTASVNRSVTSEKNYNSLSPIANCKNSANSLIASKKFIKIELFGKPRGIKLSDKNAVNKLSCY